LQITQLHDYPITPPVPPAVLLEAGVGELPPLLLVAVLLDESLPRPMLNNSSNAANTPRYNLDRCVPTISRLQFWDFLEQESLLSAAELSSGSLTLDEHTLLDDELRLQGESVLDIAVRRSSVKRIDVANLPRTLTFESMNTQSIFTLRKG
jgi:hypothetical protein